MKKLVVKKTNSVEAKSSEKVEPMFSKEQILASAKYTSRRDLVDALLDNKKSYTIEMVDEAINKFMKGQVK